MAIWRAARIRRGPRGFMFTQTMIVSAAGQVRFDRVVAPVDFHLLIDPLGRAAESQFAECDQIAFGEEVLNGMPNLLRHVDLAVFQPLEQIVRRKSISSTSSARSIMESARFPAPGRQ